jgi:hypothetical protein
MLDKLSHAKKYHILTDNYPEGAKFFFGIRPDVWHSDCPVKRVTLAQLLSLNMAWYGTAIVPMMGMVWHGIYPYVGVVGG